jgi:hypothetical protein
MKKQLFAFLILFNFNGFAQEHFTGLTNSSRVGIITVGMNPAELSNLANKFEFNTFGTSINVSNNKIGFNDIIDGKDLKNLLFIGTDPVNMRLDAEVYGPSVAFKLLKWGFAVTTKANGKLNVIDVDVNLGDALINKAQNDLLTTGGTTISNSNNQRLVGTTWGEVGLSVARSIINSEDNKFSVGATFKLLFPGSYSNLGISAFNGTIYKNTTVVNGTPLNAIYLKDSNANLNFAYSGNLADSFTNFNDYSKSIFGGLNGFMGDIGVNYQRKDKSIVDVLKSNNKYKVNLGLSIKNIGSMTFKNDNNYSTDYKLNVGNPGINIEDFSGIDNLNQVENKLIAKGVLDKTNANKKDFTVKLPTTFVAYADIKVISKIYVSGYYQKKLSNDSDNDQITAQDIITVTPRINLGLFEAFVPLTQSEISGFNAGFGFRLGGFYLGSGSIISAGLNNKNSKQADIYTGFRWAFL